MPKKFSQEEFKLQCESLPNYKNYDFSNTVYVNIRTPCQVTCKLHGIFTFSKLGCPVCSKLCGSKCNVTIEQYAQVASIIHKNKYDYSLITIENYNDEKIPIICKKHGTFLMRKSAHISQTQKYGCQKCSRGFSIGEELIADWLTQHNFEFTRQFTTIDILHNNRKIRFDFYIKEIDTFIEFDGTHHFFPVNYGKTDPETRVKKLKKTKFLDQIRNICVMELNSSLIRISYTRADELNLILDIEINGRRKSNQMLLQTWPPSSSQLLAKKLKSSPILLGNNTSIIIYR